MSFAKTIEDEQALCYLLFTVEKSILDDELSDLVSEDRVHVYKCYGRKVLDRYLDSLCQSCPYRSQK